jgi:anti-sigma B factor antagonist
MKIKTQEYNDVTVVELQGDFDSDSTESFQTTITDIISRNKGGIVLDMSGVGFVDSEGLEKLLWSRDYCKITNASLDWPGLMKTVLKSWKSPALKMNSSAIRNRPKR